ncbi:mechanosensitive ion channel domain-containing protein [Halobaculum sp. MBLA0143]|uniref:mechanosensitive ion channel domain-containing protein n=1 Tax=Halobaculum sp. MBLA0143 TaxID=3079933 RepID=UPI00352339D3
MATHTAAATAAAPAQLETIDRILRLLPFQVVVLAVVLAVGAVVSYAVVSFNRRLLERLGVSESIEGTAFERTVRGFGVSTVTILARLSGYFVFLVFVVVGLTTAGVESVTALWGVAVAFLPRVFVAVLVLVAGLIVGDKTGLLVDERLRGVKIPEVGLLPLLTKWSVVYVAALIALAQIGVATTALIVLLGGYLAAAVVLSAVALRDLLASGSAGLYLLLTQPYGIGDRVQIGDVEGVVQEIDVFVTHVETDEMVYLVPNRRAVRDGVARVRQ